jgi:hypothetical protein
VTFAPIGAFDEDIPVVNLTLTATLLSIAKLAPTIEQL